MNAKLYPVNDIAQPTGHLIAEYFPASAGSANVTVKMPDGEVLEGQFTLIEGPTASFGSILAAEGNTSAANTKILNNQVTSVFQTAANAFIAFSS